MMNNTKLIISLFLLFSTPSYSDELKDKIDNLNKKTELHDQEISTLFSDNKNSNELIAKDRDLISSIDNEVKKNNKYILSIESEIKFVNQRIKDYVSRLNSLTNQLLGIIGLILAIGAFFIIKENLDIKRIRENAEKEWKVKLDELNKNAENTFEILEEKFEEEVKVQMNYHLLRYHLEHVEAIEPTIVYAHLQILLQNNRKEFAPIYDKVLSLNIATDINNMANAGILQFNGNI